MLRCLTTRYNPYKISHSSRSVNAARIPTRALLSDAPAAHQTSDNSAATKNANANTYGTKKQLPKPILLENASFPIYEDAKINLGGNTQNDAVAADKKQHASQLPSLSTLSELAAANNNHKDDITSTSIPPSDHNNTSLNDNQQTGVDKKGVGGKKGSSASNGSIGGACVDNVTSTTTAEGKNDAELLSMVAAQRMEPQISSSIMPPPIIISGEEDSMVVNDGSSLQCQQQQHFAAASTTSQSIDCNNNIVRPIIPPDYVAIETLLESLQKPAISTVSVKSNNKKHNNDNNAGAPPTTTFSTGKIAQLANGSVFGQSGNTNVLSTVVHEAGLSNIPCSDGFVPLTVDYRERSHGIGKIPTSRKRRDNTGMPTEIEVLASRAIDRVLRPLLPASMYNVEDQIAVTCSVQSFQLNASGNGTPSGDPVALAINSASAALVESGLPLLSPAGCVRVCLTIDGEMILDPSPTEIENSRLDLLYAGSKNRTLMLEFCAKPALLDFNNSKHRPIGIPEHEVADVILFAQEHVQSIIEAQELLPVKIRIDKNDRDLRFRLASDLGIAVRVDDAEELMALEKDAYLSNMKLKTQEALDFIFEKLGDAVLRLFSGKRIENGVEFDEKFLSKQMRGMRENAVRKEVRALIFERYNDSTDEERHFIQSSVIKKLMKEGMRRAAIDRNRRSDGRKLNSIRPISMSAPLFPDSVHGSAIFTRGETQVISTATLGAPKEGLPLSALYSTASEFDPNSFPKVSPIQELPVGSLRSTKNEMALISDLNSRKIKADREQTGDSGTLDEVQQTFLHYDFPSFATGEAVGTKRSSANRRAIGHGSLAEKAILPALPPVSQFPYSLRITSEVTSSNGSSSMATTSGATLALLDAGVRILAPIAGVSIGLVVDEGHYCTVEEELDSFSDHQNYALMVDLTGTEDYYGEMDFKIAGSPHGITAMQLDVKYPGGVPIDVISEAMTAAKEGREEIFDAMSDSNRGGIADLLPRPGLKATAPRVEVIRFDPARKRDLIGPGGAILKQLESQYGVALDLSQEGQCLLHGRDAEMVGKAKAAVMDLVADVEEGGIYEGVVMAVKDFGAVVELLRNKEGLLHVSELTDDKNILNNPEGNLGVVKEMVKVGDKIRVLCIGVDPVEGSIRLSRKRLKEDDLFTYSSAVDNPVRSEDSSQSSDAWRLELIKDANRERNERTRFHQPTAKGKISQRRVASKNVSKGGSRKSRNRRLQKSNK